MTEWKPTIRRERSAPLAPLPPDRLPAFGSGSLTRGVAEVVVRPVRSAEAAEDVGLVLWRIRGVGGIELTAHRGDDAVFAVTLVRPTALGSDLRAAFGRDLVACTKDGDRFVVEVHAPAIPAPAVPEPLPRSPLSGPRSATPGDGQARFLPPGTAATPAPGPSTGGGWSARAAAGAQSPAAQPSATQPAAARPRDEDPPAAPPADGHGWDARPGPSTERSLPVWAGGPTPVGTPSRAPAPAPTPAPAPAPSDGAMLRALDADAELSIVATGPDRVVRTVIGGLHHHFGRAPLQPVGRMLSEVLPLRSQQALSDRAAAAVRGSRSTLVVDGLPGGRSCEFAFHPAPRGDAAPGCVVVARDVTRTRREEGVVAELSRVFDVTFDASFVGVGLVSAKGEWLRVNPALQALLGHRDTQLVSTKVDDVTQVDDVAREAHVRDLAIRAGETSYELDKRLIASGGDVFVAHVRMTGIVDDGEIRGWVAHVVAEDAWQRLDAPARPQRSRGPLRRRTG